MSEGKRLTTLEDVITFIQAGKAKFTVRSVASGTRFTYRVNESDDGKVFFVSLMNGPDNEVHFTYLGIIRDGAFRRTAKSRISEDAVGHKAFAWLWMQLSGGRLPDNVEVWHEGHCGRCGRALTVPESIDRGIGPECMKHSVVNTHANWAPALPGFED